MAATAQSGFCPHDGDLKGAGYALNTRDKAVVVLRREHALKVGHFPGDLFQSVVGAARAALAKVAPSRPNLSPTNVLKRRRRSGGSKDQHAKLETGVSMSRPSIVADNCAAPEAIASVREAEFSDRTCIAGLSVTFSGDRPMRPESIHADSWSSQAASNLQPNPP